MITLFGLAGSGKGTQGRELAELFGWRWLSVGEAIRQTNEYDEIIIKRTCKFCFLWNHYDSTLRHPFRIAFVMGFISIILALLSIILAIL